MSRTLIYGALYHGKHSWLSVLASFNQDAANTINQVIQHDTCGLDQLLKYFLTQCVIDGEDRSNVDQDTLLQQCLNEVLPICNEQEMQTLLHA